MTSERQGENYWNIVIEFSFPVVTFHSLGFSIFVYGVEVEGGSSRFLACFLGEEGWKGSENL